MSECRKVKGEGKDCCKENEYQRTQMQKEMIIEKLKEHGGRITKQRLMLLDIILENECSSCKEIFYKASKIDRKIGTATVYRMINALEDIGAISRKNMYRVAYSSECAMEDACTVVLDDATTYHLSAKMWNKVVQEGLNACGFAKNQKLVSITFKTCSRVLARDSGQL
ncbi:Fur family ferric uptake transcriptional regulator [Catenibacillus scindens]|uniref:Fur family ferric uptake transcriptional regulator n=2 Tax=Catenibacillus scindens TaxID=673271 RepID=A0A7W8M5F3_9FIRM|nr:Fur family ferric uptake transcriptional regulator [Catenibacillus scindens]